MIVDKAVYAGGRRHECPDAAAGLADARSRNEAGGPESERAFVWVGLFEPTGDEVREFTELFAMHPLMEPVRQLIAADELVPSPLNPYLSDVQDHLLRADDNVMDYDQSLTDILQAHLAMVSVKQGEDARQISAWAALAVIPTIVGAIYGMNFDHMPELHTAWGYPVVLLLTAAAVVLLYWRFRRSGWL